MSGFNEFMAIEMHGKKFNTFFDMVFADHDTLNHGYKNLYGRKRADISQLIDFHCEKVGFNCR